MTPRGSSWILLVVGALGAGAPAFAQESGENPTYTRDSVFRIPFQTDSAGRLRQIQLYVSTDRGATWRQEVAVQPTERYFDFRAPQDGQYWFAVRTLDLENRGHPATIEGVRPGLRVIVDTQPPVVRLKALPSREGDVGVEWEVREENPLPNGTRLDYRMPGGTWVPVGSELAVTGQRSWRTGTNGQIEVRLAAEDRAGNRVEEKAMVTPGDQTGRALSDTSAAPAANRLQNSNVRLVNSKRIALNYEIRDKGPSGVSSVELWYTQDPGARSWQKLKEEDGKSPPPFVVDAFGEGLYGFTLVVRSGVGLGEKAPQIGDQPQAWVEVDLTKPSARLTAVDVGRGTEMGKLTLRWMANDKNLGPQPITLSYAEQASGPWTPITSNVDNSGSYIWQMPKDVPYQFLVRVEATDKAGNVGSDETPKPVIVDLFQPKGVIVGVEPMTK